MLEDKAWTISKGTYQISKSHLFFWSFHITVQRGVTSFFNLQFLGVLTIVHTSSRSVHIQNRHSVINRKRDIHQFPSLLGINTRYARLLMSNTEISGKRTSFHFFYLDMQLIGRYFWGMKIGNQRCTRGHTGLKKEKVSRSGDQSHSMSRNKCQNWILVHCVLNPVAYLVNRQMGHPKRAHLHTLRAPGRKGATGPQGAAGHIQGVFCRPFWGQHLRSIFCWPFLRRHVGSRFSWPFLKYNTLQRHRTP